MESPTLRLDLPPKSKSLDESAPLLEHRCDEEDPKGRLRPASWLATLNLACTAGTGILVDGADLASMNLAIAILEHQYPEHMGPRGKSFAVSMTFAGVILGQLTFGPLADIFGRKAASLATAFLALLGGTLSACVVDSGFVSIAYQLGVCRFLLGLGIGGEYPLSAAISREAGSQALVCSRSKLLMLNMTMYYTGTVMQSLLILFLLVNAAPLGVVWRLSLAVGASPALLAFALRLRMQEPKPRLAEEKTGFLGRAVQILGRKWKALLCVCLSWHLLNVVSFGQGAFASIICDRMLGKQGESAAQRVHRDASFALITNFFAIVGVVPPYLAEGQLTLSQLQLVAFVGMAVAMGACAALYVALPSSWHWILTCVYCLWMLIKSSVGITVYMSPSEFFPKSVRTTASGIAAASGKVGGLLATATFPIIEAQHGLRGLLFGTSFVCALGAMVTMTLAPALAASEASAALRA